MQTHVSCCALAPWQADATTALMRVSLSPNSGTSDRPPARMQAVDTALRPPPSYDGPPEDERSGAGAAAGAKPSVTIKVGGCHAIKVEGWKGNGVHPGN